jgi:hypothetical protein
MDLKSIVGKVQYGFDWLQDALKPVETRWLVFISVIVMMLLFKAAGAHGFALLIALIYIMYFVTMKL